MRLVQRRIASRMRSAAASARSGVGKVAITASPMVLTTAPRLGRDDLVQHAEMLAHQVEGDEIADPLVELGRALEVGEQEGEAGDLQPLVDVERVGAIDVAEGLVGEQALGGQERPALAEQSCSASPAIQTPGSTRASVWFSSVSRSGPGRSSTVLGRRVHVVVDQRQVLPLAVGSPLTSMNCAACVTGSNTMTNSAGSCSDRIAFSPGGSSTASRVISFDHVRRGHPRAGRRPSPRRSGGDIPRSAARRGSCAAIRRTRGLTVKVTSTISSSVGS